MGDEQRIRWLILEFKYWQLDLIYPHLISLSQFKLENTRLDMCCYGNRPITLLHVHKLSFGHEELKKYNWPEFLMTHPTLISIPTHGPEDCGLRTVVADLGGPTTTDLNLIHYERIYRLPIFTIFLSNFILISWFTIFAVLWMLYFFIWLWILYSNVSEHSVLASCSHRLWSCNRVFRNVDTKSRRRGIN